MIWIMKTTKISLNIRMKMSNVQPLFLSAENVEGEEREGKVEIGCNYVSYDAAFALQSLLSSQNQHLQAQSHKPYQLEEKRGSESGWVSSPPPGSRPFLSLAPKSSQVQPGATPPQLLAVGQMGLARPSSPPKAKAAWGLWSPAGTQCCLPHLLHFLQVWYFHIKKLVWKMFLAWHLSFINKSHFLVGGQLRMS